VDIHGSIHGCGYPWILPFKHIHMDVVRAIHGYPTGYPSTAVTALDDEYQRWCQRPWDRFALESPPLEFWTSYAIKETFPQLQKMALDVFTIPAMSDEPKMMFSSTGLMARPHRSRLSQKDIAMSQCLRNWSQQDLVTFQIFETMKERLQHVETLHQDV
jgi:hypothetical protein